MVALEYVNKSVSPKENATKTTLGAVRSVLHQISYPESYRSVASLPCNPQITKHATRQVNATARKYQEGEQQAKRLELLLCVDDALGCVLKVGTFLGELLNENASDGLDVRSSSAGPSRLLLVHYGVLPLQHQAQE